MLMESLAAGRSISLPALSVGAVQLAARVVSAYAVIREQFDVPIGRFEGVEEPLTRIAGLAYVMNAARTLTAGAVDAGERPAVLSAVGRQGVPDRGHAACHERRAGYPGRRGYLSRSTQRAGPRVRCGPHRHHGRRRRHPDAFPDHLRPGRHRCHPWLSREIHAVEARDVTGFDRAL